MDIGSLNPFFAVAWFLGLFCVISFHWRGILFVAWGACFFVFIGLLQMGFEFLALIYIFSASALLSVFQLYRMSVETVQKKTHWASLGLVVIWALFLVLLIGSWRTQQAGWMGFLKEETPHTFVDLGRALSSQKVVHLLVLFLFLVVGALAATSMSRLESRKD